MRLAKLDAEASPRWIRAKTSLSELAASCSLWLLLGLAGLAMAWLIPGRFLPWPAFRQEVMGAVGCLLIGVAALVRCRSVYWPRLGLLTLAVAVVPITQWALGRIYFRGDAVVCALYLTTLALSMCVGASLARSALRSQFVAGIVVILIAVGVLSSGMALNQWLGPSVLVDLVDPIPTGSRPIANLGQPNLLATQLLLGILAVVLAFELRWLGPVSAILTVSWLGIGAVLSQSRTAWVALGALVAFWVVMHRRIVLRTSPMALGIACFAFAVGVLALPALQTFWSGPNDFEVSRIRLDAGTRPTHWSAFLAASLREPWFGYGWNQVANAQFAVATEFPSTGEWATYSHNLVLDLVIYNGIPLGLIIATALSVWLVRRVTRTRCAVSCCFLAMILMLLVHAQFEYPLYYSYYLLSAGLLMGYINASSDEGHAAMVTTGRSAFGVSLLVCSALAGALGIEYLEAEESLRDLQLATQQIGSRPDALPRPEWLLVDGWAAYHRASSVSIAGALAPPEFENLRRVAARYPYPNVLERYALALAFDGQAAAARHVLTHACKVHKPPVCDGMRQRWGAHQGTHADLQAITFPVLLN